MSFTDSVSRVAQIQSDIASVRTAFDPPAAATSKSSSGTTTPPTGGSSFAATLAQATAAPLAGAASAAGDTGGAAAAATPLSATAASMLTSGQQQFAARLSAQTGLSPQVIAAWLLAEESSGAAQSRQSANNNDWLNIGYTDSGTYGSSDSIWSNPTTAADATAGWLKGQDTIPGYGKASAGIQAILQTAGQSPSAQVAALQHSGWASSGYPSLPSLLAQVGG
jgi:hypothetical protein